MALVACKKCGKKSLAWKETMSGYKLCDNLGIHHCQAQKSSDDFTLKRKSSKKKGKIL